MAPNEWKEFNYSYSITFMVYVILPYFLYLYKPPYCFFQIRRWISKNIPRTLLLWFEGLCTPPPQIHKWNPNARVMVLGDGALGDVEITRAEPSGMELPVLWKRAHRAPDPPLLCENTMTSLKPDKDRKGPSPNSAGPLILKFQPPELWDLISLVYKPPSPWYFVTTGWLDLDGRHDHKASTIRV